MPTFFCQRPKPCSTIGIFCIYKHSVTVLRTRFQLFWVGGCRPIIPFFGFFGPLGMLFVLVFCMVFGQFGMGSWPFEVPFHKKSLFLLMIILKKFFKVVVRCTPKLNVFSLFFFSFLWNLSQQQVHKSWWTTIDHSIATQTTKSISLYTIGWVVLVQVEPQVWNPLDSCFLGNFLKLLKPLLPFGLGL